MSDKSLVVIMGASCVAGTMELYHSQLRAADIDFHVEPLVDIPALGYNLGFKIDWLRRFAKQFADYEKIVFSDAFDIRLFCHNKQEVIEKIPTDKVLWAAEKNCYPEPSFAPLIIESYPERGDARYVNGGLSCGTPKSFLEFCDEAERHELFHPSNLDQYFFDRLLSIKSPLMHIDHRTELFFCTFGGYSELEFESGLAVNRIYGTHPNLIHSNGSWDQSELNWKVEQSLL